MRELLKGVTRMMLGALLGASLGLGAGAWASEAGRVQGRVARAAQEACAPEGCAVGEVQRVWLEGEVYQYSFQVRVGPGEHDVIGLHRVVREGAPWRPVSTPRSAFLVHGDAWGFDGVYRPLATFLAQGGVDVWGIDLRWVGVPEGTTDFTFMKDWTLGSHARDVRTGLAVARGVRLAGEGQGGRMHLLGWSRAALLVAAVAGQETQLPRALRHVGGLIPMDMVLGFGPEDGAWRAQACARYRLAAAAQAAGQYEGGLLGPAPGKLLQLIGLLAATDPDGQQLSPPLSNRQLALALGAATFALGEGLAPVPFYHLVAGQFDAASGLPSALTWTGEADFHALLRRARPYQGFVELLESEALLCGPQGGAPDLPYDDHLASVSVPVLYVGAAGGFGAQGLQGLSLLGSADKTVHFVQRLPAEARVMDYGHADLLLASDAREELWTPILRWIDAR